MAKIISLLINFSVKMLVSTVSANILPKSSLKTYARILYTHTQNNENSLLLCGKKQ